MPEQESHSSECGSKREHYPRPTQWPLASSKKPTIRRTISRANARFVDSRIGLDGSCPHLEQRPKEARAIGEFGKFLAQYGVTKVERGAAAQVSTLKRQGSPALGRLPWRKKVEP